MEISVPEFDGRAMRFEWEADGVIKATRDHGTTLISANRAGLVSLARHLLTLAQENVPDGNHLHLDDSTASSQRPTK